MLFNSLAFFVFFLAVWAALRMFGGAWRSILLVSSLLFYTLWTPVYLVLLAAELAGNYLLLKLLIRSARPRLYLAASCVLTLGLLAMFKYAG